MKRAYLKPAMNIAVFETENVVTLSGDVQAYNALTTGNEKVDKKNITLVETILTF